MSAIRFTGGISQGQMTTDSVHYSVASTVDTTWFYRIGGAKNYELTNHLGNVLAVVSDLKIPVRDGTDTTKVSYWEADLRRAQEYYPFGMVMEDRQYTSASYRFGFNGMEKDDEVKGDGNSYTSEFRQYDPRITRWLSVDPLTAKFPAQSPYVAFNNNPIYYRDPTGLQGEKPKTAQHEIKKDENLTVIAKKYNTDVKTLLELNPELKAHPNFIRTGDFLNIPIFELEGVTITSNQNKVDETSYPINLSTTKDAFKDIITLFKDVKFGHVERGSKIGEVIKSASRSSRGSYSSGYEITDDILTVGKHNVRLIVVDDNQDGHGINGISYKTQTHLGKVVSYDIIMRSPSVQVTIQGDVKPIKLIQLRFSPEDVELFLLTRKYIKGEITYEELQKMAQ